MVTLRISPRGQRATRGAAPVRTAVRNVETTLYRLPVMSRFTKQDSFKHRVTRPLVRLSKTQRTIVLSVAAGAAFIALDATIAGIVIGYRKRRNSGPADEAAAFGDGDEESPDAVVGEMIVEEPDRTVLVQ